MYSQEDVVKMFLEGFQNMGGQLRILENHVPAIQQFEYFDYARKLKKRKLKVMKDSDYSRLGERLESVETPLEEKKKLLSILALSKEVRAFRLLEQYMKNPDEALANWASMALLESRIAIESELSDEKQIFISSGLGGKNGRMRFCVLIPASHEGPFEDYQRNVIETEFGFFFPKNDCEIERLTIKENYVELVFLIPITKIVWKLLEIVISECNLYGNFLSRSFTVTNVKEFTQDDVNQILERHRKELKEHY